MRSAKPVWKIVGRLREKRERDKPKWMSRIVYFADDRFPGDRAEEILQHRWSEREHEVEVRSINRVMVEDEYGTQEQMEVIDGRDLG